MPLRAQVWPSTSSAAMAMAALLHDEPYYLGGLWALTFWRLTPQQYTAQIDAFVVRSHQPRTLRQPMVPQRADSRKQRQMMYRVELVAVLCMPPLRAKWVRAVAERARLAAHKKK